LFFRENFDKRDYDILKEFWQRQNVPSGNSIRPGAVAAPSAGSAGTSPANGQSANGSGTRNTGSSTQNPSVAAPSSTQVGGNAATTAQNHTGTEPSTSVPVVGSTTAGTNNSAQGNQAGATAFEDRWRKYVHDGIIPNTAAAPKTVAANPGFLSQPMPAAQQAGDMEFVVRYDPSIYDGRFANNGWLQELPKPLSKTVWDNIAMISPHTAEQMGINRATDKEELVGGSQGVSFINTRGGNQNSDLVTVDFQGAEIQKPVPMWITPGHPDGVVTLFMGYGRTKAGKIGTGLGYSVFDVRRSDAMDYGTGRISKRGEQASIASSQIHFNMEGRDLLRVWTLDNIEEERKRGEQENFYDKSMYPYEVHQEVYNKNHKWGMSIDINSCVGCNACVMACVAENNIPVVGKEQVERSREMHWLRVDAYYGGEDINNPEGPYFQPLPCQQCEQAPCEVVCPVHATVHSAEGLNDMVYNRCVGTRYCSNNCPYKVRRFNFFLYQDWYTPQYKLMHNPEVSIRSRGVMEKCTYCTQRIAAARIEAEKDGGRPIRDGEVTTACQTACPTDAIIFGDMRDGTTNVAKSKQDIRTYVLLNELNTQPRTTYMAGLKNQNKEMPDYRALRQLQRTGDEKNAQNETGNRSEH